jgi:hypothetical protein
MITLAKPLRLKAPKTVPTVEKVSLESAQGTSTGRVE